MPSLFRFLMVVAVIGGIVYGVIFALANLVSPKPREMTITIPADVLARTAQKHDCPSTAWLRSYPRRTGPERGLRWVQLVWSELTSQAPSAYCPCLMPG